MGQLLPICRKANRMAVLNVTFLYRPVFGFIFEHDTAMKVLHCEWIQRRNHAGARFEALDKSCRRTAVGRARCFSAVSSVRLPSPFARAYSPVPASSQTPLENALRNTHNARRCRSPILSR